MAIDTALWLSLVVLAVAALVAYGGYGLLYVPLQRHECSAMAKTHGRHGSPYSNDPRAAFRRAIRFWLGRE